MALDLINKVITEYKADASDHVKELKKLKKEISEQQKAELDAHEARNEKYERWLKNIANVNQALEIGGKVIGFAVDSWKSYADHLQLAGAAGKANIDRLRTASLGLRTETDLLSFAAKAQNGIIHASQADMETAQRAMVALTRAGFDQEEVTKKITDAMVKAKTDGLDDFGLAVKAGKSPLENYTNLMKALGERAAGVKDGTLTAAEGVQQVGVSMNDSIDKMKRSIGELVQSLAPLVQLLTKAVELIAEASDAVFKKAAIADPAGMAKLQAQEADLKARLAAAMRGGGSRTDMLNRFDALSTKPEDAPQVDFWAQGGEGTVDQAKLATFLNGQKWLKDLKNYKPISQDELDRIAIEQARAALAPYYEAARARAEAEKLRQSVDESGYGDWRKQGVGVDAGYQQDVLGISTENLLYDAEEQNRKMRDFQQKLANMREADNKSFLESSFGTLEEFNAYSTAFSAFSDAVGGTYDAIVTGSEPAGRAFKRLIADSLMATGKQSAVEALKELAYAAGSLAFGNAPGAALHLKAAGLHAAVAVAAGAAAHAVGTSAQVAASDKAAAEKAKEEEKAQKEREKAANGGSSGSSGSSGKAKETFIVAYLDPFANQPEHVRRQQAAEMIRNVTGGGPVENS